MPDLRLAVLIYLQQKIKTQRKAATMEKHLKGKPLFQLINKKQFDALVIKWGMDKGVKSFTTWEMTQTLISCFILRLESYRDIEINLNIPDSTFGDALRERRFGFFQELCDLVLKDIRAKTNNRKIKKALRQLRAIDSTEIKVHGSLFNESGWKQKHCKNEHKASAKLHVVWDVDGQWIDDFKITPGRSGDSPISLSLNLEANKIYVFDRAYNDLKFWEKIVGRGSHLVTRLKDYPRIRQAEIKLLLNIKNKTQDGVLYDGPYKSSKKSPLKLRHIIYRDPETRKIFHFVTSDLKITAQIVADIYKKRWSVELLFRWLKGHLQIRRLPTKTPNAIKTQLAVAVLVQLLLQLKKIVDNYKGTLWQLLRSLRATLNRIGLTHCDSPPDCRWNINTYAGSTS